MRCLPKPINLATPRWATAEQVGRARQELIDATRVSARRQNQQRRHLENVVGYIAEAAWALYFHLPIPDFQKRIGGDAGHDFRVGRFGIDTKGCKFPPQWMPVTEVGLWKKTADVFALIWCPLDEACAYLIGGTSRERVLARPVLENCYEPKRRRSDTDPVPGRVVWVGDPGWRSPEAIVAWVNQQRGQDR